MVAEATGRLRETARSPSGTHARPSNAPRAERRTAPTSDARSARPATRRHAVSREIGHCDLAARFVRHRNRPSHCAPSALQIGCARLLRESP